MLFSFSFWSHNYYFGHTATCSVFCVKSQLSCGMGWNSLNLSGVFSSVDFIGKSVGDSHILLQIYS